MTQIANKIRFDGDGEEAADGKVDYAYRGFNYDIKVAGRMFKVRIYDDEPGVATVITADARTAVEVNELAAFILQELSVIELRFYCGPTGSFKAVDPQTLEFFK